MGKAQTKDIIKEIKNTKKRFISIVLIILLGVGFYAGIKFATPAMQYTVDKYFDELNFMDFRLVSEYGITKENIKKIEKEEYIDEIMPAYSKDVLMQEHPEDKDKFVVKVHSIPQNIRSSSYINRLDIVEGRLPEKDNELAIDVKIVEKFKTKLGDKIYLYDEEFLKNKEYTVTAIVHSPLYISIERGSTTLGNGTVLGCVFSKETNIKQDVYSEVFVTVKNTKDINSFSKAYEKKVKKVEDKLEELGKVISDDRYNAILGEATDELNEGKTKLNDAKKEKDDKEKEARVEIEKNRKDIQKAEAEINRNERNANVQFANAEKKLRKSEQDLKNGESELNKQKAALEPKIKEFNEGKKALETNLAEVESNLNKLLPLQKQLNDGIKQTENGIAIVDKKLADIRANLPMKEEEIPVAIEGLEQAIKLLNEQLNALPEGTSQEQKEALNKQIDIKNQELTKLKNLEEGIKKLEKQKVELPKDLAILKAKKAELDPNISKLQAAKAELLKQKPNLEKAEEDLKIGTEKLAKAEQDIKNGKAELVKGKNNLAYQKKKAYSKIVSAKAQLEDAKEKLKNGEAELEDELTKANEKIDDAEKDIVDAEKEIKKIEKPQWYTLGRDKNQGFEEYKQNTFKIEAIAKVFPIVFFVVAALVCLTSMTRMVEEQRLQIGTMKSLGYNNKSIINKYIIYALLATVIGCIIGILIGVNLIPRVIANAYAIMYTVPQVEIPFELDIVLSSSLLAIGIILFATVHACRQELQGMPATLMRPKAPKKGKRILLEKIPFIWNKLNFIQKVTARNIFRYKKKFFMTIIGIAGCTALVVTGFGIKDSVSALVPKQFGRVFKYNTQIMIEEDITTKELNKIKEDISSFDFVKDFTRIKTTGNKIKANDVEKECYLVVPEDNNILQKQVIFRNRITGEDIKLEGDYVILTEKLAKLLDVKVGDKVSFEFNENKFKDVTVTAITENYVGHYIYMSKELYEKNYEKDIKYNMMYIDADLDDVKEENFSVKLLQNDKVLAVNYLSKMRLDLEKTFNSLNKIVTILIVAASLLALVVLYNLSNINISERIRELATIKVLGFYDKEVLDYVHRESKYLTLIGIVLGLIGGFFLEAYIIKTVEVDITLFMPDIKPISYVYAVIVTLVSTMIVNIFVYFALKKIDMIESLKSVE